MKQYTEIDSCRVCENLRLEPVLDLGIMAMGGIFPQKGQAVPSGPLDLVRCVGGCGLVQLRQTYHLRSMYGDNYGYRSGLNGAMVQHLESKAQELELQAALGPGDIVVDIGSNDGTLLSKYRTKELIKIGIDPTAKKFRKYYDEDIEVIEDFFSANDYWSRVRKPAKLITSIAMLYDLPNPTFFMYEISNVLATDGIWHFEQSYLPTMLKNTAYDTICHEHLEYYSLKQIEWMANRVGLKIIDATLNNVNGGSIAITATKADLPKSENLIRLLAEEAELDLDNGVAYVAFKQRVIERAMELSTILDVIQADGKTILGYGASTKGNTLLQYTGIDYARLAAIVEVNEDKYGKFTPGTHIPITSEAIVAANGQPDYYLVLPWHFREGIIRREKEFLRQGGKLLFPLPDVEIYGEES